MGWEIGVVEAMNQWTVVHPSFDPMIRFLASYLPEVSTLLLVIAWFAYRREDLHSRTGIVCAAVAALSGIVVAAVIGHFWYRPRPFVVLGGMDHPLLAHVADASFPSDHATVVAALAAAFAGTHRRLRYVLIALAMLCGAARVAVGVHWPTDILGGFALGTMIGWTTWSLRRHLERFSFWLMHLTWVIRSSHGVAYTRTRS
ncbi:MAG: phosphatase PAP2 family protein [Firmicutes bacterium]|nr:phosphatase PAP2 family protein [Bacillota bacterium]